MSARPRLKHRASGDEDVQRRTDGRDGVLQRVEDAPGFALPPLLASVYREVGNGGFGPDHHTGWWTQAGDGEDVDLHPWSKT